MSLNNIVDEFEKDSSVTSEQLISTFYSKENLSLKTEIPFSPDVEIVSAMKDVTHLVGELFLDVKVLELNPTTKQLEYKTKTFNVKDNKGVETYILFGEAVTKRLQQGINFSEEYAVSHKRKGRQEGASMLGKQVEIQKTKRQDTLGKMMGGNRV